MLRSSNPILTRQDAFTPAEPRGYQQGHPQQGQQFPGYQPAGYGQPPPQPTRPEGRMTMDDVILKTAILFAVMMASAAVMFLWMPASVFYPVMIFSALAGLVTSFVVAFRRKVSPALVVPFAVLEGFFVGGISRIFESAYDGIVAQAVFGTFCAAVVTFAAYKFLRVRISGTMAKVVVIAMMGIVAASLLSFLLSFAGINLGIYAGVTGQVGLLAWGFSIICVVIAVFSLIMDFQVIEDGVRNGAPASESWRGAFGLLVTMVWLYLNILRLISYIRR